MESARRSKDGRKSRFWCFTVNNYSDGDKAVLGAIDGYSYLVYGMEVGEENQTPHLQGYIEFPKRVYLKRLQRLTSTVSTHVHWEARKGNATQAAQYCKKDGKYQEFGTISKDASGARCDLDAVRVAIKERNIVTHLDLLNKVDSMLALNIGKQLLSFTTPVDRSDTPPHIFWIHGPTGCGKSRMVYEFAKALNKKLEYSMWTSFGTSFKFYDGYYGQEIVLFDDFRPSGAYFSSLLRITDRYNVRVEVKGGSTWWIPKFIFFTGPKSIEEAFTTCDHAFADGFNRFKGGEGVGEDIQQFRRRVMGTPKGWGAEIDMTNKQQVEDFKNSMFKYIG